ncbi:MAG TPA: CRISPR-associated helicase Cas3' [Gammaproteobacteria bacterium]|nr:CRISPR-associated helicase Cas3' [Gammaproteobacteria bacterium]
MNQHNEHLFRYWGKAQPSGSEGPQYHLLPYHCLDVAAVGFEYLSQETVISNWFCGQLHCSQPAWVQWAAFWLSLHDLGKFSEAFQSQKPELFEALQCREPDPAKPYTERHDSLGQWLWRDHLADRALEDGWFGGATELQMPGLDVWMRAVTGHHGQPPKAVPAYCAIDDYYSMRDKKVALAFVDVMRDLLLPQSAAKIPAVLDAAQFEHVSQALSWWFAGVAVLADWLGSNTEFFAYQSAAMPLEEYWRHARQQATKALQASGVVSQKIVARKSFADLFNEITTPSPLQQWAIDTEIMEGPQIHLLEDVTGAGKTEAALTIAYRLMEKGAADSFFIALPTMATANAMYARMANFYKQLFAGDASLVLAHGSRQLVERFAASVFPSSHAEDDLEQVDETASARCTAWLADHNKRALLSQAGVGTIDQALLGVLHSKHQSLRLLGLFHKVLIVDEVHACDAYMQGVLEVLLEFHARAGGSVILLTATLSAHMKQALLAAYARGRDSSCPSIQEKKAYPLATSWRSSFPNKLDEAPLGTRAAVKRTISIDYRHQQTEIVAMIDAALASGQCVCWIRNTVADAMGAFELYAKRLPQERLTLFHARFALGDRLAKEEDVLAAFGPKSNASKRAGRLVIATQVIEQSLDVDFDLLVSDLAPIDRLIQRAGRLRRHNRDVTGNRLAADEPDQRGMSLMVVFGPAWNAEPAANWFKNAFPKAAGVYPDHSQLWLTAKALRVGNFSMPDDARILIEGVFGEASEIPQGLQRKNLTVLGQQMADASHAKTNALNFSGGYRRGDILDWWSEAKTPSRLGDASVNVVLARWAGGRLSPWAQRPAHAWAYSTARVAERLIASTPQPEDSTRQEEYLRITEQLPAKGKWSILLALEKNRNGRWQAQAWGGESPGKPAQLRLWEYDDNIGLRLVEDNNSTNEEAE